jgi:hypothetical protein
MAIVGSRSPPDRQQSPASEAHMLNDLGDTVNRL